MREQTCISYLLVALHGARRDIEPHRYIRNLSRPEAVLIDHGGKPVAVHGAEHPVHRDNMLADAQLLIG